MRPIVVDIVRLMRNLRRQHENLGNTLNEMKQGKYEYLRVDSSLRIPVLALQNSYR